MSLKSLGKIFKFGFPGHRAGEEGRRFSLPDDSYSPRVQLGAGHKLNGEFFKDLRVSGRDYDNRNSGMRGGHYR